MMKLKSVSLKIWLPTVFLASLGLTWLASLSLDYVALKRSTTDQAISFIRYDMSTLMSEMEHEIVAKNLMAAEHILIARALNRRYNLLVGADESGVVIYSNKKKNLNRSLISISPFVDTGNLLQWTETREPIISLHENGDILQAYFPLTLSANRDEIRSLNQGMLYLEYDLKSDLDKLWYSLLGTSLIAGLPLIGLALLWFLWIRYIVSKPVQQLVTLTEGLAKGERGERIPVVGKGEFAMLAASIYRMTDEIDLRFSQREAAKVEIEKGRLVLSTVFASIPDSFFLLDVNGNIVDYKASHEKQLHLPRESILGQQLTDLLPPEIAAQYEKAIRRSKLTKSVTSFEYALPTLHGSESYEARLNAVLGSEEMVIVVREITEQKLAAEKIRHQAMFDALTGLPNRYLAMDRLDQLISKARRSQSQIGLLFLDLDDFKKVNDVMGHQTGDQLLIEFASRLKLLTRDEDTVARLGGDEFIFLLSNLSNPSDAAVVARKVIKLIKKPFEIDGQSLAVSVSVGIAIYPDNGSELSALLSSADSAMYSAKSRGRNKFDFYSEQMDKGAVRRRSIEEQLASAINQDEFKLYFQPQINLLTGAVMGAEALIRWDNKQLGRVSPAEFIPIAEYTDHIFEIGRFVVMESIRTLAKWLPRVEKDFRIAINLSPKHFRQIALIDFIRVALDQYNVPARCLEIEVTEGVLLNADDDVRTVFKELKMMGVIVTMDDFGTGYSSLNNLRQFPFDVVKIDQSFIRDLPDRESDAQLISAAIGMGSGLGLSVVAEGIETMQQLNVLRALKCPVGQGYLFAKPMPQVEFEQWLEQWTPDLYIHETPSS